MTSLSREASLDVDCYTVLTWWCQPIGGHVSLRHRLRLADITLLWLFVLDKSQNFPLSHCMMGSCEKWEFSSYFHTPLTVPCTAPMAKGPWKTLAQTGSHWIQILIICWELCDTYNTSYMNSMTFYNHFYWTLERKVINFLYLIRFSFSPVSSSGVFKCFILWRCCEEHIIKWYDETCCPKYLWNF